MPVRRFSLPEYSGNSGLANLFFPFQTVSVKAKFKKSRLFFPVFFFKIADKPFIKRVGKLFVQCPRLFKAELFFGKRRLGQNRAGIFPDIGRTSGNQPFLGCFASLVQNLNRAHVQSHQSRRPPLDNRKRHIVCRQHNPINFLAEHKLFRHIDF